MDPGTATTAPSGSSADGTAKPLSSQLVELDIPYSDPQWVRYAGGYARMLKAGLHSRTGITKDELFWLQHNAPEGMKDPDQICDYFINDLVVLEVTERISK